MNARQKTKLSRATALLGIIVCLTGCASTGSPSTTRSTESQQVEESILQELSACTEPSRFVETVNEDLRVDATVVGYPANGMGSVYNGAPKDFTKEEIEGFVKYCGEDIISIKEWDDGAMAYYNGECTNSYRFGYMWGLDGLNNHPYAEFRFFDTNRYMTYYDYPIYSAGEENYITNPQYTVGWMFTEPKEFSFATETEAEIAVRESLAILGLPELTLLRTLYIDHNTLAEAGRLLSTEDAYAPIGGAVENNGYVLRDDWSEEDDAYMFNFGISISGTPMSFFFDDSGETATYCGSEIIVWYTKYGITYLSISTPWTIGEKIGSPEQIIPAQSALEVVKEKYSCDLQMKDKCIEEIRLLYRYSQNRAQWLLRPVWVVRISFMQGSVDERYYEFMYIDALTGEEI